LEIVRRIYKNNYRNHPVSWSQQEWAAEKADHQPWMELLVHGCDELARGFGGLWSEHVLVGLSNNATCTRRYRKTRSRRIQPRHIKVMDSLISEGNGELHSRHAIVWNAVKNLRKIVWHWSLCLVQMRMSDSVLFQYLPNPSNLPMHYASGRRPSPPGNILKTMVHARSPSNPMLNVKQFWMDQQWLDMGCMIQNTTEHGWESLHGFWRLDGCCAVSRNVSNPACTRGFIWEDLNRITHKIMIHKVLQATRST